MTDDRRIAWNALRDAAEREVIAIRGSVDAPGLDACIKEEMDRRMIDFLCIETAPLYEYEHSSNKRNPSRREICSVIVRILRVCGYLKEEN